MEIVKIDLLNPDEKIIKKSTEILKSGGTTIYPTDTAYGLGGNALDQSVVQKIYELKGRDFSKPTHVVVRDWEMVKELTFSSKIAKRLYDKFLPGPLTLVLLKKDIVPNLLTANLPTLGIRLPDTPTTKLISQLLDFPYTTPSANKSGGKTPYSIGEVKKELDISKVDLILDAGKLPPTPPSTIVDLTKRPPKIIRDGPVTKKQIGEVLGSNRTSF